MEIKTLLNKEIQDQLTNLSKLEFNTDEYKSGIDGVSRLLDRNLAIEKEQAEQKLREEKFYFEKETREKELYLKEAELIQTKKDQRIKNLISGGSLIGSAALFVYGLRKTIKFEEVGTFTTTFGKSMANGFSKLISFTKK